ncbi:efflux RND transporter permease subunit [Vibrio coralliilyticus]|uniref:efflux RND transporter permease subunit n=1 Tax=Vibrio coralliilyticus TaxID=190893 RepID=UPI002FD16348
MQTSQTNSGIIAWFARNSVAANLLMALIVVAGLSTMLKLRTESFPSIPPNSVTVSVVFDSGSAESSEEGVALKIEEALQGVDGIKTLSSSSSGDSVSVTITKTSGYELDTLYQDIKNKVDAIDTLPQRAEKPVTERAVFLEDVISVNLYGDVKKQVLQQYAEDLRAKLLASSQIQKVDYVGRSAEEITIQVDESKLQALGLSLADVASKVSAASVTDTGGELEGERGTLILKTDQQREDAKGFLSIPVMQLADGRIIRLSDIAVVKDDFADKNFLTRYNGSTSVGLKVKMYGKSNITVVADEVTAIVRQFEQTLPTEIHAELWNNQSEPIKNRLSLLMNNSFQGVLLVIALLALFLNIRVALWVGVGLPVIFSGAMILMGDSFFGMTLNEMTTFGFIMALGIVVDDAVVIGESIYEEREKRGASIESTIIGAQKVATPTTFGVLTTMVAFMSISLVEGDLGKIFAQFAYAAAFCLLFSLIESKLILPSHLAHVRMHSNSKGKSLGAYWNKLQNQVLAGLGYFTFRYYKPFLALVLTYRYAALAMFISFFVLVAGALPSGKIKAIFFPEISMDFIQVDVVFKDDAGFGLVQREALELEKLADVLNDQLVIDYQLDVDPIQDVLTETTDNTATLTVGLSANDERPVTASDIAKRWQSMLSPMEGIESINFGADMISEKDISIELRSKNNQTIEAAGHSLVRALGQINGVSGVKNGVAAAQVQADIQVTPNGLALGLTDAELLNQLKYAYQGYEIQRLQKEQNEVKVKIQYPDMRRQSLSDLQYTDIRLPNGKIVPLTSVATISTRYASKTIERIDYSRVNQVTADVDKAVISPQEVVAQLQEGVLKQLQTEFRDLEIVISGQQKEQDEITQSLMSVFVIALVAIYALLAVPLKSYFQPVIIMFAIPFGIIGALLGHMLHGIPISLLSLFGILALAGVVVNDSLLLISRYNTGREAGLAVTEALLESGTGRLRAILLTSTTTYFGLVPLLTETSPQAQFLIPAATSMGYGILFATIITLVLIPALVMINEDLNGLFSGKKAQHEQGSEKEVAYE